MQNQPKVIDKKVKTYIIFDRVHKTKVEVLKFMGKTLYLECYSGISGDMTVGALLDLGVDKAVLDRVLQSLPVSGFQIKTGKVVKSGIAACDFDVAHIIEHSAMTDNAKKIALRIFEILAEAESKAHDVPVEQVHFHEVGAVDSIVDIVSVAVCLDNLDITDVVVPVLYEGCGTVRCQHGILPIPVPAVANVISANHLCIKVTAVEGELVTPTGAAIVAAIRTKDKLPEEFEIKKIGIGAGKRQYECPGILRAMIIS